MILDVLSNVLTLAANKLGYKETLRVIQSNRPDLCDYQCDEVFKLTKVYQKSPLEIGEEIVKELNEIVKDYRDNVTLTEDSVFAELGFDSLDRVELIMAVEEKFDITFPDDVQIETVKELVDKINELMA